MGHCFGMFTSKTTQVEDLDLGSKPVKDRRDIWVLDSNREFSNTSNRNVQEYQTDLMRTANQKLGPMKWHQPLPESSSLKNGQTTEIRVVKTKKIPTHLRMPKPEVNKLVANGAISLLCLKYNESHCLRAFSGILVILFAVLNSAVITVWPQYNVILNPQYWYEPLFPICLGYILIGWVARIMEVVDLICG